MIEEPDGVRVGHRRIVITVPFELPSGSWFADDTYVAPAETMPVTVNVIVARLRGSFDCVRVNTPVALVVHEDVPVAAPLHDPVMVAPATAA